MDRLQEELSKYTFVSHNPEECWPWVGPQDGVGYGRLSCGFGKRMSAHRASCIVAHGRPEKGQWALHSCDNPLCCNPHHLSWGSNQQNQIEARDRLGSQGGKLDWPTVKDIRAEAATQETIAKKYGLSQAYVGKILNFKVWLD